MRPTTGMLVEGRDHEDRGAKQLDEKHAAPGITDCFLSAATFSASEQHIGEKNCKYK